ncbi:hypothetical protein D3C71_2148640 [compost metagenome]
MQVASNTTTGVISMTTTRGTVFSIDAQKVRMPTRFMAIIAARPETIKRVT